MESIKYYELLASICQFIAFFMLLKSCFHLWRVREDIPKTTFYLLFISLTVGTVLHLYNISSPLYVLERFPFNIIYLAGSAFAFYVLTKSKKEELFTIERVMKKEYSEIEKRVLNKVSRGKVSQDPERVEELDLMELEEGKAYTPSRKTMITRLRTMYFAYDKAIPFKWAMLSGGEFGAQFHPKLREEFYLDIGEVENTITGEVYKSGDKVVFEPGQIHGLRAKTKSEGRAYLMRHK